MKRIFGEVVGKRWLGTMWIESDTDVRGRIKIRNTAGEELVRRFAFSPLNSTDNIRLWAIAALAAIEESKGERAEI